MTDMKCVADYKDTQCHTHVNTHQNKKEVKLALQLIMHYHHKRNPEYCLKCQTGHASPLRMEAQHLNTIREEASPSIPLNDASPSAL